MTSRFVPIVPKHNVGARPDGVSEANLISGQGVDWRFRASHKRLLVGPIPTPATLSIFSGRFQ